MSCRNIVQSCSSTGRSPCSATVMCSGECELEVIRKKPPPPERAAEVSNQTLPHSRDLQRRTLQEHRKRNRTGAPGGIVAGQRRRVMIELGL